MLLAKQNYSSAKIGCKSYQIPQPHGTCHLTLKTSATDSIHASARPSAKVNKDQ